MEFCAIFNLFFAVLLRLKIHFSRDLKRKNPYTVLFDICFFDDNSSYERIVHHAMVNDAFITGIISFTSGK